MLVARCGDAPVPPLLFHLEQIAMGTVPTAVETKALVARFSTVKRLIVCGNDAALAALVTRCMKADTLDVEFAFISDSPTEATRNYRLPTGHRAAQLALNGRAVPTPLLRDDNGTALVGVALLTGVDGKKLVGEAYADDERIFSGTEDELEIRPTIEMPGAIAATRRRRGLLRRRHWYKGRAIQLGTTGAHLLRDGVPLDRILPRSTFYRHVDSWMLVHT